MRIVASYQRTVDFVRSRVLVAVQAAIFAVWSVVYPVVVSAAVYNAAGPFNGNTYVVPMQGTVFAGSRIGAFAAVTLGRLNPWVNAAALGLGVGKMVLELKDGTTAAIRTEHAPVPAPPGWTDNPLEPWAPVPPGTASPLGTNQTQSATNATAPLENYVVYGTNQPSFSAAKTKFRQVYTGCTQWTGGEPAAWTGGASSGSTMTFSCDNGAGSVWTQNVPRTFYCPSGSLQGSPGAYYCTGNTYYCPDSTWTLSGTTCSRPNCPVGYAYNGSACALSDPSVVKRPPDGEPDFKSVGNTIIPDPLSSDNTTLQPNDFINPNHYVHPDQYGNPLMYGFTPLPDGSLRFDQSVQLSNNGQTQTTNQQITLNKQGQVISSDSVTYNGPITNTPGTPAPTSNAGGTSIELPNDYNREVTQQKILTGEGAQDKPDFDAQVQAKKLEQETALKAKIEEIPGQFSSDKGSWFSWVWTPPVGSCSPWVSTIHGQTVTWNVCPYIANIRDVIGFVGSVLGTWLVYNELFRREES